MSREWIAAVTGVVNLVTTAETAAITSQPVSTSLDGDNIGINGSLDITTGASVTAVVIRVRRGSGTGGALVGNAITHTIGAAVSGSLPFDVVDTPGAVAGQQYTVTAQQTAATTNGSVTQSSVSLVVGQP